MSEQVCTCGTYGGEYPVNPSCPTHNAWKNAYSRAVTLAMTLGCDDVVRHRYDPPASIELALRNDPPVGG